MQKVQTNKKQSSKTERIELLERKKILQGRLQPPPVVLMRSYGSNSVGFMSHLAIQQSRGRDTH